MKAPKAIVDKLRACRIGLDVGPCVGEGALHELAHAVVFGMDLWERVLDLAGDISNRYDRYKSPRAADRSECMALAVEAIAARRLGLPIHFWREVVPFAIQENMRAFSGDDAEVRRLVRTFMATPIARRRASRVVSFLRRAAERRR